MVTKHHTPISNMTKALICVVVTVCLTVCSGQETKEKLLPCQQAWWKEYELWKTIEDDNNLGSTKPKGKMPTKDAILKSMERDCPAIKKELDSMKMPKPYIPLPMSPICKNYGRPLTWLWHQGQWCNVVPVQIIRPARCDYRPCCKKFDLGTFFLHQKRCRPANPKTFLIHIHCPKVQKCFIVKKMYYTSCECQALKCLK